MSRQAYGCCQTGVFTPIESVQALAIIGCRPIPFDLEYLRAVAELT